MTFLSNKGWKLYLHRNCYPYDGFVVAVGPFRLVFK